MHWLLLGGSFLCVEGKTSLSLKKGLIKSCHVTLMRNMSRWKLGQEGAALRGSSWNIEGNLEQCLQGKKQVEICTNIETHEHCLDLTLRFPNFTIASYQQTENALPTSFMSLKCFLKQKLRKYCHQHSCSRKWCVAYRISSLDCIQVDCNSLPADLIMLQFAFQKMGQCTKSCF